jgi:hypothetical protein
LASSNFGTPVNTCIKLQHSINGFRSKYIHD